MEKKKSLSNLQLVGYASGILTESFLYNMFFGYIMIFLTDVAFVIPILAGTISMIAVAWDAITAPIVGYLSDREGADKRKFLLFGALPMCVFITLTFMPVDFSDIGKFVYYTVLAIVMWVFYTIYTIPYYALGAEITDDYDERTKIRGVSNFINSAGIYVGSAVPTLLVAFFVGKGISEGYSWTFSAAIIGVAAAIIAIITYLSVKNTKLIEKPKIEEKNKEGLLKTYMAIIKLKPMKWYIIFTFFYLAAFAIISANNLYLLQYRVGADATWLAVILLFKVALVIIYVPIFTWIATKTDRRTAMIIFFSILIAGLYALKIIGITSVPMMFVLNVFTSLGTAGFWVTFYSMGYDLVEVDELVNGKRREGAITSFPQFIQKIGSAIGMQFAGIVLTIVGYNAALEIQTTEAALGIESITTILTPTLILISLIGLIKYPITKKKFDLVRKELEKKRNGEEYSTEGLEGIV